MSSTVQQQHLDTESDSGGPLSKLCRELRAYFEAETRGPADVVVRLMKDYIDQHDDWKEYCLYHPAFYARNLVEANEHFELIVCISIHLFLFVGG